MSEPDVKKLLREGIAAARAAQKKQTPSAPSTKKIIRRISVAKDNQKEHARQLLEQVTELDETNVPAWLWLSTVMDDLDDRSTCLNNVLVLDPDNRAAKAGLAWLNKQSAQAVPTRQISSHNGCPFCDHSLSPSDTTCPYCKLPLVMNCPACNTPMDVEWKHCTRCDFVMGNYRLGALYFMNLATAYQEHRRTHKAANALRIAKKIKPDQPDLYRQIGQVQAAMGQSSAAIASLQRAVELEPDQARPYLALGKVLQQEGRWRKAENIYRQAIKVVPKSAETYFALGDLFMQRNRLSQARNYLQKALQLDPQHGLAWARLGQVYELLQKRPAAIQAYQRAVDLLDPESFDAKQSQERLTILQPTLPAKLARGWGEFIRQITGPILIAALAALLDSGLRPWWVPWTGWLALSIAIVGTLMWVSATSLPQNPFICSLIGPRGLGKFERPVLAFLGAFFWLLAMGIILMPIGQSFPEPPS
jgi:Flp pilus assembly protein TadD